MGISQRGHSRCPRAHRPSDGQSQILSVRAEVGPGPGLQGRPLCLGRGWASISHQRRKPRLEPEVPGLPMATEEVCGGGKAGGRCRSDLGSGCQPTVSSCWLHFGLKKTPAQETEKTDTDAASVPAGPRPWLRPLGSEMPRGRAGPWRCLGAHSWFRPRAFRLARPSLLGSPPPRSLPITSLQTLTVLPAPFFTSCSRVC